MVAKGELMKTKKKREKKSTTTAEGVLGGGGFFDFAYIIIIDLSPVSNPPNKANRAHFFFMIIEK